MQQERKEKWMENNKNIFVEKWHSVYFFIPLFENPVVMPAAEDVCSKLSEKFGRVTPLSEEQKMPGEPAGLKSFVLWDHLVHYSKENQDVPSQLVLYGGDVFDRSQFDESIKAQFWACPDREAFLERCRYSIMASNMLAAGLPPLEQYGILASYADALLELFPDCIGIYWPHSRNLVPREIYTASSWKRKELHFLDGGLNVRFFTVGGTDEFLFDTLGLTPIGLPDLQIHCRNLEPDEVVVFLRNLAAYLFEYGDVIEDGNTVEGIHHEKWVCQREDAMAGPMRVVLDVNSGDFAAGNR